MRVGRFEKAAWEVETVGEPLPGAPAGLGLALGFLVGAAFDILGFGRAGFGAGRAGEGVGAGVGGASASGKTSVCSSKGGGSSGSGVGSGNGLGSGVGGSSAGAAVSSLFRSALATSSTSTPVDSSSIKTPGVVALAGQANSIAAWAAATMAADNHKIARDSERPATARVLWVGSRRSPWRCRCDGSDPAR